MLCPYDIILTLTCLQRSAIVQKFWFFSKKHEFIELYLCSKRLILSYQISRKFQKKTTFLNPILLLFWFFSRVNNMIASIYTSVEKFLFFLSNDVETFFIYELTIIIYILHFWRNPVTAFKHGGKMVYTLIHVTHTPIQSAELHKHFL